MPDELSALDLHRQGFADLNAFWDRLDRLEAMVAATADTGPDFTKDPIARVLDKIRAFEPSVSVIGQVKAGKSTLLNALIGEVDLLPSDVNPWTSVITALHLNARYRPPQTRALFRFFDADEWDRLVATGGRLGEMADRAGFASEAEAVRAQVTEMRVTTEARLGDEFDGLLGASHAFPDIDKSTIDRYICYGDPDELEEGSPEGVYADLTKSADLYIDLPDLPRGLCLRDTPGVNDTFMMREQITLNAISDSRVCVIVLSAHQALSTMDLALLRIICSVNAREVLIFVNRIDELPDPGAEIPRITASINKTLQRMGLAEGIEILFGSGHWANYALRDGDGALCPSSRAALAAMSGADVSDDAALRHAAMQASGVPALHRAIARRIVDGTGAALLTDVQAELDAITAMTETVDTAATQSGSALRGGVTPDSLAARTADVRGTALATFDAAIDTQRAEFRDRLDRARDTFMQSAVAALQSHISAYGESTAWKHDPTSLRMAMKTAYVSATARLRREGETALDNVLDDMQQILQEDLGVFRDNASVDFPEQPQQKAPTVLARTLSLDLEGPWWRRFWRLGRRKAAEKRYRALIEAEISPLIDDLLTDFYDPAVARTRAIVDTFAKDQSAFLLAVLDRAQSPQAAAQHDSDSAMDVLARRLSA